MSLIVASPPCGIVSNILTSATVSKERIKRVQEFC